MYLKSLSIKIIENMAKKFRLLTLPIVNGQKCQVLKMNRKR